MEKGTSELSSRYYPSEILVWSLGAVLYLYLLLGLKGVLAIRFLSLTPKNTAYFPYIVGCLLLAVLLYLSIEFKQSTDNAKNNLLNQTRLAITTIWAIVALWLTAQKLIENTEYANISFFWYVGFVIIGLLLGYMIQLISFSTLMIRSQHEANTLDLPRIPNFTRVTYKIAVPFLVILLIIYFYLHLLAPNLIVYITSSLTAIAFLYILLNELVFLFIHSESNGNRVSFRDHIAQFKKIYANHDRTYDLIDFGEKKAPDLALNLSGSSKKNQNIIRKDSAAKKSQPHKFNVEVLEEFQIQPPSGNEISSWKIVKSNGSKDEIRVLFHSDTSNSKDYELVLAVDEVEKHFEKYIAEETGKTENLQNILSKAINQTTIELLQKIAPPPLTELAAAGDIDTIKDLIKQGHNINTQGKSGWTALLSSVAQGYPKITKTLLDAGANPDISNVLGITPLMYAARYGRLKDIRVLIDYGANVDLQDMNGNTALMKAVEFNHIKVLGFLIEKRADISIKNIDGKKALDLAYELGRGKIARNLRKVTC